MSASSKSTVQLHSETKSKLLDLSALPRISIVRRNNLIKLRTLYGNATLADMLDASESFLSQRCGKAPTRVATEKSLRQYEERLNLPIGLLDREDFDPTNREELDKSKCVLEHEDLLPLLALDLVNELCAADKIVLTDCARRRAQHLTHVKAKTLGAMPSNEYVRDLIHLLSAAAACLDAEPVAD